MTIYVGNLSFDAEVEDLQHLFAEYGSVSKCSLPLDRETGRKRGFAFVDMADANAESKAIADLQDVEWMGRSIRVNKAEPFPTAAALLRSNGRPCGFAVWSSARDVSGGNSQPEDNTTPMGEPSPAPSGHDPQWIPTL
jgi:RNA recognition motif-containing protein